MYRLTILSDFWKPKTDCYQILRLKTFHTNFYWLKFFVRYNWLNIRAYFPKKKSVQMASLDIDIAMQCEMQLYKVINYLKKLFLLRKFKIFIVFLYLIYNAIFAVFCF